MNWVVEEPTRNAGRPAEEESESCPYGEVVPNPTNPLFPETSRKGVLVPWSETTNIGVFEPTNPCTDSTERSPHGEVVATPTVEVEKRVPTLSVPIVEDAESRPCERYIGVLVAECTVPPIV
jgi:hypothetical protein